MKTKVKITGTRALRNSLKQLSKEIAEGLSDTINDGLELIENGIREGMEKTPIDNRTGRSMAGEMPAIDTSKLVESFTLEKANFGFLQGTLGTSIYYAKYLEYGTSRMSERPFFFTTFNKNKEEIKSKISSIVSEKIALQNRK